MIVILNFKLIWIQIELDFQKSEMIFKKYNRLMYYISTTPCDNYAIQIKGGEFALHNYDLT